MRDLDHQLTRPHRIDHVLTHRFLLHAVGKLLRSLIVHIGFEQRFADVLDRLRHVDLRDSSLAF